MSRVVDGAVADGTYIQEQGHSTAAPANILTYTCPAGRQAVIRQIRTVNFAGGAPTIAFQLTIGGNTFLLSTGTTPAVDTNPYNLQAGDTCNIRCTAGAAGSTVDAFIMADEYLAA